MYNISGFPFCRLSLAFLQNIHLPLVSVPVRIPSQCPNATRKCSHVDTIYHDYLPPFIAFALNPLVPWPFCVKSGMTPFMEMPSSYPE
jgi:hypothetical protein